MRGLILALPLLLCAGYAAAQEAPAAPATTEQTTRDRDYLTGLLEDNLSAAGRAIRLDGFAGALSSRATFDSLSIADDAGVWLTITDGAISWSRSALLSGRIEIEELSAKSIDWPRLPVAAPGDTGAAPEVKPFALPELPVSVNIGKIEAGRVTLGEALFGQAAEISLSGALELAGGEGKATLSAQRIDGPEGTLSLNGAYANASRELALDLLVSEGEDGIAANLIGLPGRPAITLAVAGTGPIDDFTSDIHLTTDDTPRLSGKVELRAVTAPDAAPGTPAERSFRAELSGDIAPLLPPEYQDFFGDQVALLAEGAREPTGRISLPVLSVDSEALDLSGSVTLLPTGLPERLALDVQVGLGNGREVLLPLAGDKTWVRSADLRLDYDKQASDGWKLDGRVVGLRRAEAQILALRLSGSGRIAQPAGRPATIGGTVDMTASGIEMADPALADAVGPFLSGRSVFFWQDGDALRLPRLHATGRGYGLTGGLTVRGLDSDLTISGKADLRHSALGYLSALAGRPLGGRLTGTVEGEYAVLTGAFDTVAEVAGTDLRLDQPQLDGLLAGESRIALSARRDETGITLRGLDIAAQSLSGTAQGVIRSGASDLTASARLGNLRVLDPRWRGALVADAGLTEKDGARLITLEGTGSGLAIGQAEIDRVLAGETRLSILAEERGGRIRLQNLTLKNPQLGATAEGVIDENSRRITVDAQLANAALLAPGFPGPVTLGGTITDDGTAYQVDLAGTGPGNSNAKLAGRVALDFADTDLGISGSAETALANAFIAPRSVQGPLSFDLRMRGAPGLGALSGRIEAANARLVAPTLGLKLDDLDLGVALAGGQAEITGTGQLSTGGTLRLSGPVSLSAPYSGDLQITLEALRLRDPDLYDTQVSGGLSVSGPLAGGARVTGDLTLSETELRVPSTGLGGVAAIPDMTHVNEPAAVRDTRQRAGLIQTAEAGRPRGASASYPLDVTISAPRQIFVRGRGLDAELGGSLRITGTSENVTPIGEFGLIRGRLDILGKRFALNEGKIALQGALIPWLRFVATTQQDGFTTSITIEGDATEPELTFTSSPELPEEEVLARLLFNKGLTNLSPLQAAQLASAVATLAGKGGEGIVSKLRSGFGLDDLDVGTSEDGGTQVRAGKYLSENIYTDVVVDSEGKSEINLNLDVTRNLTAKGRLGSDGNSGVGIYFERDY